MGTTIEQKKLIFIILSSALLIFIFVFGINAYYKDKENKQIDNKPVTYDMMEMAKLESSLCFSTELKNQYRICCVIEEGVKKGLLYDCTSQKSFEPGQHIYIVFDTSKFDIPYDPYFLRVNSDLDYESNKSIFYESNEMDKNEIALMKVLGFVPREGELFTLLKLSVYPSNTFNTEDEQVILRREAKIFKE